jgi:hypothetical protein
MLREMNGIWCLPRNSFVRKQLVQPGCQYTLMGSSALDSSDSVRVMVDAATVRQTV